MNNVQKRAIDLVNKIGLFQLEASKCLRTRDVFTQEINILPWENICHLSQREPGLLVASILFFVARVEQEISQVFAGWDGKTLPLFSFEDTLSPTNLVTLQSEYGAQVKDALKILRRRVLERYGNQEGDSDNTFLTAETEGKLKALELSLSRLMEDQLLLALQRIRNDAH